MDHLAAEAGDRASAAQLTWRDLDLEDPPTGADVAGAEPVAALLGVEELL